MPDKLVFMLTDISRALNVDVDQNIATIGQVFGDRFQKRSVLVTVNVRVLQKLARFRAGIEFFVRQEAIVFAVDLAGAGRARCT